MQKCWLGVPRKRCNGVACVGVVIWALVAAIGAGVCSSSALCSSVLGSSDMVQVSGGCPLCVYDPYDRKCRDLGTTRCDLLGDGAPCTRIDNPSFELYYCQTATSPTSWCIPFTYGKNLHPEWSCGRKYEQSECMDGECDGGYPVGDEYVERPMAIGEDC